MLSQGGRLPKMCTAESSADQVTASEFFDPPDDVGISVERPAGKDEHPLCAEPIGRFGHGIGGRAAKDHPFHGSEHDLAGTHEVRLQAGRAEGKRACRH